MLTTGISLLFIAPLMASAATGAVLESATDAWDNVEQANINEEQIDAKQEMEESSPELFPAVQTSSLSPIDAKREERTNAFISATVDGKTVIFSDVPRDAWFAPYVREIAELGIVSGYRDADGNPLGTFGPADHVTVEQLAKITLASSSNLGDCPSTPPVNLTASGTWSAVYISCTEKLQWTIYSDGNIDAHRDVTRAEVIVTLLQAFKTPIGDATGTAFTDVTASTLFNPVIEQAKKDGIVSGYTDMEGNPTGLFGPDDAVTRAEMSKMVVLAMEVYSKK